MRVEEAQAGAAIGVAVKLEGYDFISQTEPERLASSAEKEANF